MDINTNNNIEDKEYSFIEIYFSILKHKKIIFLSFILCIFISMFYSLILKPVFISTTTIMVSEEQNQMNFLEMGLGKNNNYIENEIEILKSRTTSDLVIEKLFNSNQTELYLFESKAYTPSTFRSILTFGLADKFDRDEKTIVNLDSLKFKYSKKLQNSISIVHKKRTDAIVISVSSIDPTEAALLSNMLVEVYIKRNLEWTTGEMTHLKSFLIDQLNKKEFELNQAENNLRNFQEGEKIFSLDENSSLILKNLTDAETQYNNILLAINILSEKETFLDQQLTEDEKELSKKISSTINERLFALKKELSKAEIESISVITDYGKDHSAAMELNDRLLKIRSQIDLETRKLIDNGISVTNPILFRQALMDSSISLKSNKANLHSKANAYKRLVELYELRLTNLPSKLLEYTRLERNRRIHSETYGFMRQKLEEAKIGEASQLGKIRIIDKARIDNKPVYPKKILNLIFGSFIGLVFGLLISISIEFFDSTIKSIEQIERRGLAILALIPAIGNHEKASKSKNKKYITKDYNIEKIQRRLITHEDPKSPISEAYRSLRTSLMYTKMDETKCNIILVSSAGPGEGKTTTIANLAITYANLGKKTLLIDSDLRKPVIHKIFKVDKSPGLTSYLSSNNEVLENLVINSDVENLDFLTSGITPPNPSELLDSKKMISFIDNIRDKYDVVLFDSPPLIAVTDPFILMKYIDQFILVVRAGVTEKGSLERALSIFEQTDNKIAGVIMNAMTEEYSYGAGYYYNYYQYYYGDSDK